MPAQNTENDPDFDNFDDGENTDVVLPGPEDDDNGLEIDIVDDTPERDQNARPLNREVAEPTDDELASYSEKTRKRINELTHARHDERRRREQLEREHQAALELVNRARQENAQLRKTLTDGAKQFGEISLKAAEDKLTAARERLRKANEAFDVEAISEAQEELTDAKLELARAKSFRPESVQPPEDVVQTAAKAPVQGLDPKTQEWVTNNRWFTDPEHVAEASYALGLHNKLVQSGYDPRTDEYFTELDTRLKARFPELYDARKGAPQADKPRQQSRQTSSAVAPVTRTPAGKQRVTLTQSEVALCRKLGITPQQYAAELVKGD